MGSEPGLVATLAIGSAGTKPYGVFVAGVMGTQMTNPIQEQIELEVDLELPRKLRRQLGELSNIVVARLSSQVGSRVYGQVCCVLRRGGSGGPL